MLWFFMFTAVGMAIFALFLALKNMVQFPLLKLFGGTALLGFCGWIATRWN